MKRKFSAGIAVALIIVGGVISPLFGFFSTAFSAQRAYAQGGPEINLNQGGGNMNWGGGGGQNVPQTPQVENTQVDENQDGGTPDLNEIDSFSDNAQNNPDAIAPPADRTAARGYQADPSYCSVGQFGCYLMEAFVQINLFIPVGLATISGLILDFSLWYSIQSSTYTGYDNDDSVVAKGWKLVRDFSNLLFIFALFAIAFTLILGLDNSGRGLDPKRTIAWVIIMALLVNFSFFMARSVIDITNMIGLQFYSRMANAPKALPGDIAASPSSENDLGDPKAFYTENLLGMRSVSMAILEKSNPQTLILQQSKSNGGSLMKLLLVSVVVALFHYFLVYLFFSIALLFVARTIGLFLLIIVSPIAFVSRTIPALQKKSFIGFDDWLTQFFGLAFMAPIFIFFVYIAAQFYSLSFGSNSTDGIIITTTKIALKLIFIGAFLMFAKKMAKDMSGKVGEMASSAVTSLATGGAMIAGAVATGGAAAGFRGAVSQVGNLGKRYASQKLNAGAESIGRSVFGDEKVEAWQNRYGGALSLKGIRNNPTSALAAFNKLRRVGETEPGMRDKLGDAFRQGKFSNRYYDMKDSKEAVDKAKAKAKTDKAMKNIKATAALDKELADLVKDKDAGLYTPREFDEKKKDIAQRRKEVGFSDEQRAEKEANTKLKDATKERTNSDIDKKLGDSEQKLVALGKKFEASAAAVDTADKKVTTVGGELSAAEKKLEEAEKEVTEHRKAWEDERGKLTDTYTKAEGVKADVDTKLRDTEDAISAIGKTVGFGGNAQINQAELFRLTNTKNNLLADKKTADDALANASQQINLATRTYETADKDLVAKRNVAAMKRDDLAAKEKQAVVEKETAERHKAAVAKEKEAAETTHQENKDRKTALDQKVADLTTGAAEAKDASKIRGDLTKVDEEILHSTLVPKTDTQNKINNDARVAGLKTKREALYNRLGDIYNGGTTPPTTP